MNIELRQMSRARPFEAFGREMVPTTQGALYWVEERTLLVADLHLGQGQSLAARGSLIPPYDTAATLESLAGVIARFEPHLVISLGDSFHDDAQASRLRVDEKNRLSSLMAGRRWLWITGNHDPSMEIALGGEVAEVFELSGVHLAHHPIETEKAARERGITALICGHLHPAAILSRGGRALRRKCFALSARQLILPGFGSYTGGLNITHRAFGDMRDCPQFAVWMIGDRAVYPVRGASLGG